MATTKHVDQIDAALVSLAVPVESIERHPRNARRGDIDKIAASLEKFGQVRPIVVQKSTGYIVAGNHTYRAATEKLGWTRIAAARVEMTDKRALAYLAADNRLSDIAENDDALLASILEELQDSGELDGTGYDDDQVDDILLGIVKAQQKEDEAKEDEPPPPPPPPDSQHGAGPMAHREVMLILTVDQAEQFGLDMKRLAPVYETQGIAATVLAVIADAVARADAA